VELINKGELNAGALLLIAIDMVETYGQD